MRTARWRSRSAAAWCACAARQGNAGDKVVLSLRPEALRLLAADEPPPAGWATLAGQLGEIEYLGPVTRFTVTLADGTPLHLMALAPPARARHDGRLRPAARRRHGGAMRLAPPRLSARGRRGRGRVPRPVLPAAADQGVRRQHPRCLGQELHAGELHQRAVEPLLPQRPDQQPRHRGGGLGAAPCWSACRSRSASRGCRSAASRCCSRSPRCRWCCPRSSAPMRWCCCSAAPAS